ncbi:hypothetical protein [uncultured Fibrella sp.]|uniref:hypothetical protein n=1 Tax=uncultured Fibrella sp. TaxID=1284596 RepID=UPI0035C9BA6C
MKTVTRFFALFLAQLFFFQTVSAQQFLPPIERFSGSKPGYLILKTGEQVDFTLDDLDRKKGLIIRVEGKSLDGKKFKYEADQIQELGLNPSDFAKFASFSESTRSIAKIQRNKVNETGRNLVLFYNERLDDQKREALLQLVNPGFDSQMRVYDDPFAAETMGVGFGGMQLTGGMDKSFYVKTNGKVIRLKKKNYDELFRPLFDSCPAVMDKYGKSFAWRDFCYHVFMFDQECGSISVK